MFTVIYWGGTNNIFPRMGGVVSPPVIFAYGKNSSCQPESDLINSDVEAVGKPWTVTGREMAEGSDGSESGMELGQGGGSCGRVSVRKRNVKIIYITNLMIVIVTQE